MVALKNSVTEDKIKYVNCVQCHKSGVIISPFLAPKKWRRHFIIVNPHYVYYCQSCYETYVRGKPLF